MDFTFVHRHNGPRPHEIDKMLQTIGVDSLEALIRQTVPSDILLSQPLPLETPQSEHEYLAKLKNMVAKNKPFRSLIGMGYYGAVTPPPILRYIFENPSWYTSYTPYQAEISQGRLEALLNFQTMIVSLTGLPLANCSLLDESTAAAEAMRMMFELRTREAVKAGKNIFFIDQNTFPQTLSVLKARAEALGILIQIGDYQNDSLTDATFGALVQYPAANGEVRDYADFCNRAHEKSILVCAVCDLLSLAILKEPGAWGADIAVGSAQRFGLQMGFGGPTTGYMACRDDYKRQMPGRIIGISIDRLGNKAYRMALQTREQHIKREKATSNICTASALMATMAGMFAVYHGSSGIRNIALHASRCAHAVGAQLQNAGYTLRNQHFFDTIEVINIDAKAIRVKALVAGINFFYPDDQSVRFSFDQLSNCAEAQTILRIFGISFKNCSHHPYPFMERLSPPLTQSIFNTYHSETELMRYIKKLERRDLSLTHSMIPLGSCTMKLNAAAEMLPLSWAELGNVHPFAPSDQVTGYMELIRELEHDLSIITGLYATSLQPNSGAAGEYSGLMVIRAFHQANNQMQRNVVLIPTSAHGTNPASAAMAGMEIVLIDCDQNGNINVDDLRTKAIQHKERLSNIMITYPSTHGVFEEKIREIVSIIHENGGLVYMDGANMNAQVGFTHPGFIGVDVCHLNLHKTFAMPHGGGGPGLGPICVTKELAPYLPGHPIVPCGGKEMEAASASPYGSPLLLPITHAYIKLLGAEGLKSATEVAILNANYLSTRLKESYPTVYTGANGRVAHECILDLRHFRKEYGIDATDIAKRLMDYGFHAPTLSFPVVDTLMVEPTESESLAELDRFIEAMLAIKAECEAVKNGTADKEDNLLKNAPHTAAEVCANDWSHPYPREQAAYPLTWLRDNKFWPHVTRVDNGYGDRNLVCVCG
ncbi:MAG: aminomethyl-transferring glycine dehydrogenase [Prevotellaceae bacterium]|jgi:glycine dehydrogenase|nr:aminomethyl-transferring glycine dehydrogenase [Prevotellaceae bacterium]